MNPMNKSIIAALAITLTIFLNACSSTGTQTTSSSPQDFAKKLQEDLIKAKPGSVIEIPAGKFSFDKTLSLNVANVTIRGKGMKETILSFTGQKAGSAGLMVKADDFVIEDLAIDRQSLNRANHHSPGHFPAAKIDSAHRWTTNITAQYGFRAIRRKGLSCEAFTRPHRHTPRVNLPRPCMNCASW